LSHSSNWKGLFKKNFFCEYWGLNSLTGLLSNYVLLGNLFNQIMLQFPSW
jgi:hypothetical protein